MREEQQFGCHCDLEPHEQPDGCVLDDGRPYDCVYARNLIRNGKSKADCWYWRDISTGDSTSEIVTRQRELIRELAEFCAALDGLTYSFDSRARMEEMRGPVLTRARKALGDQDK